MVPQVCWGGEAVEVTVERTVVLSVTTSLSVETVAVMVDIWLMVVVLVVVTVFVGDGTAWEHADERMVAGYLARTSGVDATSRLEIVASPVGSRWLG